jgi:hypothetical protein
MAIQSTNSNTGTASIAVVPAAPHAEELDHVERSDKFKQLSNEELKDIIDWIRANPRLTGHGPDTSLVQDPEMLPPKIQGRITPQQPKPSTSGSFFSRMRTSFWGALGYPASSDPAAKPVEPKDKT